MKRRITTLLLAAIMVFCMIPASLLTAMAHGKGVAKNSIENLSIYNAPDQSIPATAIIDGKEDDTAWPHDQWQIANDSTGIWDAIYYRSGDFSFKYQLHSDYQYLYGIVVLDTNDIYNGTLGDITIWLNSDESVKHYTSKIVLDVDVAAGTVSSARYSYGDVALFDESGTLAIDQYLDEVTVEDGIVTVEFRSLTKTLAGVEQATMSAYVSVDIDYNDVTQTLYHPRFDAAVDFATINPKTAWPANATVITQREIYSLPTAEYSKVLPNEMVIDGKLLEGAWAPYTTMYTEGKDRYEYRADGSHKDDVTGYDSVDFSNVKYHMVKECTNTVADPNNSKKDVPIKFKYDIRVDKNMVYGAIVAYADLNTLVPFNKGEVHAAVAFVKLDSNGQAITSAQHIKMKHTPAYTTSYGKYINNGLGSYWCNKNTDKDTRGRATRTSDFLVEFEFACPLSEFNFKVGDDIGWIVCVDTHEWVSNGDHSNGATYGGGKIVVAGTEHNAITSYYNANGKNGCKDIGNWATIPDVVNTENFGVDGRLEIGRWTAIKAMDNKVDYMTKLGSDTSKFTTEHMAYDVFIDDDYLYGVAVVEKSDFSTTGSNFNLWINNGVPRWNDIYDNKLSFSIDKNTGDVSLRLINHYYLDDGGNPYSGTENMLTGIINARGTKTAIESELANRGFISHVSYSGNTATGGYAFKWLISKTENVVTQGVEAVSSKVANDKYVLEFKVPLEMLLITETEVSGLNTNYAFTYIASEGTADGGSEQCHPMASNRNLNGKVNEKIFAPTTAWNSSEYNVVKTDYRFTNNIGDGKLQEYYWDTIDELIKVDGATGVWEAPPVGEEYIDYHYRVYTSREWLYGAAIINDEANPTDTTFTIWFNNDVMTTPSAKFTGRMEISLNQGLEPICKFYDANDNVVASYSGVISLPDALHGDVTNAVVPFNETVQRSDIFHELVDCTVNYGYASMKTLNNETVVEFKINIDKFIADHEGKGHSAMEFVNINSSNTALDDSISAYNIENFYIEPRENIGYVVSVTHENNTLYHLAGDNYMFYLTGVNDSANSTSGSNGLPVKYGATLFNGNKTQIKSNVKDDGFGYILFAPTELENVYKVAEISCIGGGQTAVLNAFKAAVDASPEGSFLYKVSGNMASNTGVIYPTYAMWSHEGGKLDTTLYKNAYVRLTNVNPYGTTLEEVTERMGNEDVPSDIRGYSTKGILQPFAYPGASLNDINAPENTDYPATKWTKSTQYNIAPLMNYVPEDIDIDGYVSDSGWDDDKWIYVSNDVNGNTQNPGDGIITPEFEYKYQMRNDGEYVYVAAVMDYDPGFTATTDKKGNIWQSGPQFRIWIQSQGDKYQNAISFTHAFDIRLGAETDPNNSATNKETTLSIDKYTFGNANMPYSIANENGIIHESVGDVNLTTSGSKASLTYKGVQLRFLEHQSYVSGIGYWDKPNGGLVERGDPTTKDQTNGFGLNSAFWGETKVVAENTKDGTGSPYAADNWFATPKVEKYVYGNEHAAYNSSKDGNQTIVEFKFKLSDIGTDTEKGFKYYVQCSSLGSTTTNAFVLFHPNFTVEPDTVNSNNAFINYHIPFWVWGENAFYCDKQWFYDNELHDPENPVIPLGSQFQDNYTDASGKHHDHVLRFGVLYNQEYLNDVYGKTSYTGSEDIYKYATYWDVKEIGIVLDVSKYIEIGDKNEVILYTDTPYVTNVYSDLIIHQKVDSNMADYENYIFYAVVTVPEKQIANKLTYRGYVDYYPHDDIYYDKTHIPGSKDSNAGFTFRPSYYSGVITRSYNMVKMGYEKYGVNGDNMPSVEGGQTTIEPEKIDMNNTTVAYIPLDNRPVNYQRVQYLAQSTGINLIMPPEKYFTNTLDNNGKGLTDGKDSDSGNPMQLLNWLKNEASSASYYVLSLDMLFSGGLIGSRAPEVDTDYDDKEVINNLPYTIGSVNPATGEYELSAGEQAIMDYLIELAANPTKHVVYFDTVIRLASTTYYGDYTISDYNALRTGFADVEREQFFGTDLTMENIFANYNYDANGNKISADGKTITSGGSTTNKIEQYIANRKRKLTITDTLLTSTAKDGSKTVDNIEMIYIGADDSKPKVTIQTNELRYIEDKLLGKRDNAVVMAAADELGLLGLSEVVTSIYGNVNVNITYYGNGKDFAADDYDRGNLGTTTKAHVKAAGGYFDYNEGEALEILVLTRGDFAYDRTEGYTSAETSLHKENAKKLVAQAKYNLANNIPTVIVDVANTSGITGTLASYMFGYDFHGRGLDVSSSTALDDVGLLLGYSEWNTCANSLGIGISNAIARYTYLQNCSNVTEESNYGFMKTQTHAFVKDIAYRQNSTDGAKFYRLAPVITEKLNASEIYVGEIGEEGSRVNPFTAVKASDLYFPWDRHFEADFAISFAESTTNNIAHRDNGTVCTMPERSSYNAPLNDGWAVDNFYDKNTWDWYRFDSWTGYTSIDYNKDYNAAYNEGMYNRNAVFTFTNATEVAYVRTHVQIPAAAVEGVQGPFELRVYGSNDNKNWTDIGGVVPTRDGDFNLPNGNSAPGTNYPFLPEAVALGSNHGVEQYTSWVTIPVVDNDQAYKYVKVIFFGWGLTYVNEVQIYAADTNYDSDYILSSEKLQPAN